MVERTGLIMAGVETRMTMLTSPKAASPLETSSAKYEPAPSPATVVVLGPAQLKVNDPVLIYPVGQVGVEIRAAVPGSGRSELAALMAEPLPGYRSAARAKVADASVAAANMTAKSPLTPSFLKRRAINLFNPSVFIIPAPATTFFLPGFLTS
ncbi:MAG: hypothetical protein Q7R35_13240 [Elusimicrobiota bacterium]|nr:hypothetical protein [Elusimicrobiota bacterium]